MPRSKADFRKLERWTADLFPDNIEAVKARMQDLLGFGFRELAIVGAAILDAALAELIAYRLFDDPDRIATFLGAAGESTAPLASFGAKIQAAYLLGLIDSKALQGLSDFKDIRNFMAHRAN